MARHRRPARPGPKERSSTQFDRRIDLSSGCSDASAAFPCAAHRSWPHGGSRRNEGVHGLFTATRLGRPGARTRVAPRRGNRGKQHESHLRSDRIRSHACRRWCSQRDSAGAARLVRTGRRHSGRTGLRPRLGPRSDGPLPSDVSPSAGGRRPTARRRTARLPAGLFLACRPLPPPLLIRIDAASTKAPFARGFFVCDDERRSPGTPGQRNASRSLRSE